MIKVVYLVLYLHTPTGDVFENLPVSGGFLACLATSQASAARYMSEHPDYELLAFYCDVREERGA